MKRLKNSIWIVLLMITGVNASAGEVGTIGGGIGGTIHAFLKDHPFVTATCASLVGISYYKYKEYKEYKEYKDAEAERIRIEKKRRVQVAYENLILEKFKEGYYLPEKGKWCVPELVRKNGKKNYIIFLPDGEDRGDLGGCLEEGKFFDSLIDRYDHKRISWLENASVVKECISRRVSDRR